MYAFAVDLAIHCLRKRSLDRGARTKGNFHGTETYVWALRFDAQAPQKRNYENGGLGVLPEGSRPPSFNPEKRMQIY